MKISKLMSLALVVSSASFAWTPPTGIPKPAWPSDLDIARPTLPLPWTSTQSGFYFAGGSGCSDSNGNGTPTAPRCSLPGTVAAGAVIVLNGTINGESTLSYKGSPESPVWVMGYSDSNKPSVTSPWNINGSYLIIDSIAFKLNGQDGVELGGTNTMLRNSTMVNPYSAANGNGFGIGGKQNIFYANVISQMGDWQWTGKDIDRHGIKVEPGSELWIVDSNFYHCQGDGVQVGDWNNSASAISKIYVGRNTAYENLQTGFWTKNATDVIFSENAVYKLSRSTDSGPGAGMGGQYDAKFVWFINNTIHDSNTGVHIAGSGNGGGGPWYAIGNLIYEISNDHSCNTYDAGAISYRNEGGLTAIFNTVYNADFFGGYPPSGGNVTIRNNIIVARSSGGCTPTIASQERSAQSVSRDYNLFTTTPPSANAETHAVVGAPLFQIAGTDFSLKANSPAIGRANPTEEPAFAAFQSRYGIDIRRDLHGTVRPQQGAWDIGAVESAFGGNTTPPPPVPAPPSNLSVN